MLDVVRHGRTLSRRFVAVAGACIRPLGETWVAFSPLSGETLLLNDEAAAVLELLGEEPSTAAALAARLAAETGAVPAEIAATLDPSWAPLIDAGLVRVVA